MKLKMIITNNSLNLIINMTVFIISLFLGSFYNVLALRTITGEKITHPPSHCVKCGHRLKPLDLIPLLSYLFLGGKCRYCKEKISKIYPIGEFLTALSYTIIINKFGFSFESLIQIVFITVVILITITDIKENLIYDKHSVLGIVIVFILRLIKQDKFVYYSMSGILSFSLLLLIFILSKEKLGEGDIQLYGLIGLSIGLNNSIVSLFYASIIGTIFNLNKLFNKSERTQEFAFVPYILLGILITYIYNPYAIWSFSKGV